MTTECGIGLIGSALMLLRSEIFLKFFRKRLLSILSLEIRNRRLMRNVSAGHRVGDGLEYRLITVS